MRKKILYLTDFYYRAKGRNYFEEDIAFATEFIRWNNIRSGIQRIDACRTKDGKLLLVELENLNPYPSWMWMSPGGSGL